MYKITVLTRKEAFERLGMSPASEETEPSFDLTSELNSLDDTADPILVEGMTDQEVAECLLHWDSVCHQ